MANVRFHIPGPWAQVKHQAIDACEKWIRAGGEQADSCRSRKHFINNVEPVVEDLVDIYLAFEQCRRRRQNLNAMQGLKDLDSLCLQVMNGWANMCCDRYHRPPQEEDEVEEEERWTKEIQDNEKEDDDDEGRCGKEQNHHAARQRKKRKHGCTKVVDQTRTSGAAPITVADDDKYARLEYQSPKKSTPDPRSLPSVVVPSVGLRALGQQPSCRQLKTAMVDPPTANLYKLCESNEWTWVLQRLKQNPLVGTRPIQMNNNLKTSLVHKAIASRGNVKARANVIVQVLQGTPEAAAIRNRTGLLPLHAISLRNIDIDSVTREHLIRALIKAHPGALTHKSGNAQRTPIHNILTDYTSPPLIQYMIEQGGAPALFMKDKNGYLPIHIACSRHCSLEKLRILLKGNPSSLTAKTNDGSNLLALAKQTATTSHPNHSLIREIRSAMTKSATEDFSAPKCVPSPDECGSSFDF